MENFLTFLDENRGGIFVLGAIIVFIILMIQWIAWIFDVGKYEGRSKSTGSPTPEKKAQFVVSEFLTKVIADFRNLLAVMIVAVFALVLAVVLLQAKTQAEMEGSLQAVMATLGGLVGSIIGYYFGESAVKSGSGSQTNTSGQPAVQGTAASEKETQESINAAPKPPRAPQKDSEAKD